MKTSKPWVYFASGAIAIPVLQAMVDAGLPPLAVVTTVAPQGSDRSHETNKQHTKQTASQTASQTAGQTPTPLLAALCQTLGIEVISQHDDQAITALLAHVQPQRCLVFSFGRKIPAAWMTAATEGFVNIHPSRLPRWRGASPIAYTILHGDLTTAVTLIRIDQRWDHGPILAQREVKVPSGSTTVSLTNRLAQEAASSIVGWWHDLDAQRLMPTPQPQEGVTRAPRLHPNQARVSLTMPTVVLVQTVAAMDLWPGAWMIIRGERVKIWELQAVPCPEAYMSAQSGSICDRSGVCKTSDGAVRFVRLQRPGRAIVDGSAAWAGWRLRPGDLLGED